MSNDPLTVKFVCLEVDTKKTQTAFWLWRGGARGEVFLLLTLCQNFCTFVFPLPVLSYKRDRKGYNFQQNKAVEGVEGFEALPPMPPHASSPTLPSPRTKSCRTAPLSSPQVGKTTRTLVPLTGTVGLGAEKPWKVFYGRAGGRGSTEGARTKVGGGHEANGWTCF